jgi:hypothetical protein
MMPNWQAEALFNRWSHIDLPPSRALRLEVNAALPMSAMGADANSTPVFFRHSVEEGGTKAKSLVAGLGAVESYM